MEYDENGKSIYTPEELAQLQAIYDKYSGEDEPLEWDEQ